MLMLNSAVALSRQSKVSYRDLFDRHYRNRDLLDIGTSVN